MSLLIKNAHFETGHKYLEYSCSTDPRHELSDEGRSNSILRSQRNSPAGPPSARKPRSNPLAYEMIQVRVVRSAVRSSHAAPRSDTYGLRRLLLHSYPCRR